VGSILYVIFPYVVRAGLGITLGLADTSSTQEDAASSSPSNYILRNPDGQGAKYSLACIRSLLCANTLSYPAFQQWTVVLSMLYLC
jgi:hypothetical protein